MIPPGIVDLEVTGRLDDGTAVLFRPLVPGDREGLQDAFRRLSPESRYRRFFTEVEDLSEEQWTYLTEIDYVDHFAWLALLSDAPGTPGIGIGRWVRTGDPETAEAAVTVIDDYQNRGVGTALLQLMARSAIERGVRQFRAEVLGTNEPMLQLLRAVGVPSERWDGGVDIVTVPLPNTVEDLDQGPAPRILREAALGRMRGRAGRGFGTRLDLGNWEGFDER